MSTEDAGGHYRVEAVIRLSDGTEITTEVYRHEDASTVSEVAEDALDRGVRLPVRVVRVYGPDGEIRWAGLSPEVIAEIYENEED